MPVQQTNYRQSPYERPNQTWVCGWACAGRACPLGPDHKGRCSVELTSQCTPGKNGDRWHCSRLDVFGGPCEQGPLPDGACCRPQAEHGPCKPRRSWRAKRRRLVVAAVTLAAGVLAVLLAGPWNMAFISPGKLSAAHGAIEARAGASTNCAACHVAAQSEADEQRLSDSDQCFTCHFTDSGPAQVQAFFAHSLDPDRLAKVTQRITETSDGRSARGSLFISLAGQPPQTSGGQIACAVCHGEHHGRSHDLRKMADASCQVCHEEQFESFANGHPEFRPVAKTRSGIAFDHAKHQKTYFGKASFDCARCHVDDDAGRTMLLRPYEQACADCHNQGRTDHHGLQIKGQAAMLLQLPEMELDADIYWPEEAAVGERLPPIVRLLLAGDDEALAALQSLYDDEEADWFPYDWEPQDDEQVTQLASALTRLISLLRSADHEQLRQRLASAFGAEPQSPTINALAEQLASVRLAALNYQRQYAPGLADESSEDQAEPDEEPLELETQTPIGLAGWYLDHADVAVMYRPTAHGDALFKSLIDALVAPKIKPASQVDSTALRRKLSAQIFDELLTAKGGGSLYAACLRCHNLDRRGDSYKVNWHAAGRETTATGFANYRHRPHLVMLRDQNNCATCHKLTEQNSEPDLGKRARGFLPHSKNQCTTCHAPTPGGASGGRGAPAGASGGGGADQSCLRCHSYHFQRP